MNTKTKQDQKKSQRPEQGRKKRGQNSSMLHDDRKQQDHEYPERRMFR
jgi:hypothetical protein